MRGYNFPLSKKIWEEDFITNYLEIEVCRDRPMKWREIIAIEEEMKKIDPSFKGFYQKEICLDRYNKLLQDFQEIIAKVPPEVTDILEIESSKQDIMLEVNEEGEQLEILAWAQGGKKKHKLIEIPLKLGQRL